MIYVLRLSQNKVYVGKSSDPQTRFAQHLAGQGPEWTQLYEPYEIIEIKESATLFDEDLVTKQYMLEYGIDNVRGGSYTQVKLSTSQINILKAELRSAQNACFCCGEQGHFQDTCPSRLLQPQMPDLRLSKTVGAIWNWVTPTIVPLFKRLATALRTESDAPVPQQATPIQRRVCERCGRNSHVASQCWAKTHLRGHSLV